MIPSNNVMNKMVGVEKDSGPLRETMQEDWDIQRHYI